LVEFEKRFEISDEGMEELKLLSKMAEEQNVYLICQCCDYDRCHCDLLLMLASHENKLKQA